MIMTEIKKGWDGLEIPYSIREKVFIEEQGVDTYIEKDQYDQSADHVVVYEDNLPVGTGRLIEINGEYLIGRIAVLKEHRGKKYGDLIVRVLVNQGFKKGAERIVLHSQLTALAFYEKIGFKAEGPVYEEASILHQNMYLTPEMFRKPCDHN